ncbi:hypothetical protein [Stratiformator vulcanicus]|uniref:Rod shape-determining protein MreD n=1 Tax=Stratiformator vulcanicus TaxID=2527980 RepID=A0A517R3P4_9PLAN|nr:hypothetical protein [Stratiformator vulcanicus]QDT38494.1 hypothetical protein Pan189_28880 [Stratiformator vulcanicus]
MIAFIRELLVMAVLLVVASITLSGGPLRLVDPIGDGSAAVIEMVWLTAALALTAARPVRGSWPLVSLAFGGLLCDAIAGRPVGATVVAAVSIGWLFQEFGTRREASGVMASVLSLIRTSIALVWIGCGGSILAEISAGRMPAAESQLRLIGSGLTATAWVAAALLLILIGRWLLNWNSPVANRGH